jgi:hypothetical protein
LEQVRQLVLVPQMQVLELVRQLVLAQEQYLVVMQV